MPLPQEGLPGFRGVKSAGESPKGQSLRESQGLPAADTAATSLHLSRSSLQVLATLNKKLTGHMEKKKRSPPRIVGLLLCSAGDLFPLTIPWWRWGMRILQGNSSPPLGNRPSPISVRRFPEPSKEDKGSKNATLHQNRRKAAAIVALTFRGSHSALFGSLSRS